MIKKVFARGGILTAIFVIAVVIFSYLTNQGNTSMSADMGAANLPRISFETEGYEVNSLPAYEEDMEITSVRDTITLVKNNCLDLHVSHLEESGAKMTCQVYSLDGSQCLYNEIVKDVGEETKISFGTGSFLNKERVMKLTLHLEENDVYYYTRIKSDEDCNYKESLDFVTEINQNILEKSNLDQLNILLETNSAQGGNGLQYVNIYSSVDDVTWGELEPEVASQIRYDVKEAGEMYLSIQLSYRVSCKEMESEENALYDVKEFFRVRKYLDDMYLLDYERNVEQIFDGNKKVLDENGVLLGITSTDVAYETNSEGNIVSFVQDRELWNYNKEEDALSLVFSFADAEGIDERNLYDQHEIKIISVEKNGSTVFTVSGYMNRGSHEGMVGVAVYYFDSETNSVEEKAFVPTDKGYQIMKNELGRLVYYSHEEEMLYVMVNGTLYSIDLAEDTRNVLVRGLSEGQYVASEDGSMVAYQIEGGKLYESKLIRVINLETGKYYEIATSGEESVLPIGFIKNDFAYGYIREENKGQTQIGETICPMHKVEIINQEETVVKTYEVESVYITDAYIEDNMMTLERASKKGDKYSILEEDYITNNEEKPESNIYLETYSDEWKGYQMRLVYEDGISDAKPKVLSPKLVLKEQPMILNFDDAGMQEKYYVYAKGQIQGAYDKESQAIHHAKELKGVAVSYKQNYLFEQGNLATIYEVDYMEAFQKKEGQTSTQACLEKMFQAEEIEVDVTAEMEAGLSPKEILTKYMSGEGLDLTGCEVSDILYLINQETPVAAVIGNNHTILIFGYTSEKIVYLDPSDGARKSVSWSDMDKLLKNAGNVLFGYTK